MIARSTLRATLATLIVTIVLAVGHWLPWMCCGPLLFAGSGRELEQLLKLQAGFTPPAVLAFFAFQGEEFRNGRSEVLEFIGYGLFGLFGWGAMTVGLGLVLSHRFRELTGRGSSRRPDMATFSGGPGDDQPSRQRSEPPLRRPSEPPAGLRGAVQIEDIWEKPKRQGPGPTPERKPDLDEP
jgi:hypothetical protein